ncbi:hypothetical protein ICV32_01530 [Polynucleobacter sp. MWH-UH24A]|uniref:hypothetical protein n=1 Tax=Polynucleobacter sp. MWH-UH24A TaxID=2689110 RepID=UPI001BFD4237|nr:hypothetical protein [Polynucleobacter sp. MWH-UH24A]QWD76382.1 hypothetical protein ICV32_01530 [Polynucleobacter sp. MWH-UH24A]
MKPFNLSSISPEEFPAESEIIDFYKTHKTNLNHYPVDTILGWYRQDLHYLQSNFACINGIQYIQTSQNINQFDMVLIDGSEFTGERELSFVIGAKVIALDDTETFKCFKAMRILEKDLRYRLITHNPKVRNGFAIFEKI